MGETSTLTLAAPNSKSLRTTVPMGVIKHLNLGEGDKLFWELKASDNELVLLVSRFRGEVFKNVVDQLQHLLIYPRNTETGKLVAYHQFHENTLDPDLLFGFIRAIKAFGDELTYDSQPRKAKKKKAELKAISFKNYQMLTKVVGQFEFVFFIKGGLSKPLEIKLSDFMEAFLEEDNDELKDWDETKDSLVEIKDLVERCFCA